MSNLVSPPLTPLFRTSYSRYFVFKQSNSPLLDMIMDSARPKTYHEAIGLYQAQYDSAIDSGTQSHFILPQALFGYMLLFTYLFIFPTPSPALRQLRYAIFAIIVYHSISTMRHARTMGMNYGIGVGLCSSWCILWSATFLIFKEPHRDLSRIKRSSSRHTSLGSKQGNVGTSTRTLLANSNKAITHENVHRTPLVWESMPNRIWRRLDWILDLLTNLRGLNWSWKVTEKLPPPCELVARHQPPLRSTLWSSVSKTLLLSLCLDIIKVAMMVDPYFWGLAGYPSLRTNSMPLLDRVAIGTYRSVLSFAAIYVAVLWIYALVPLVCVHFLGPDIAGKFAQTDLGNGYIRVTTPE